MFLVCGIPRVVQYRWIVNVDVTEHRLHLTSWNGDFNPELISGRRRYSPGY